VVCSAEGVTKNGVNRRKKKEMVGWRTIRKQGGCGKKGRRKFAELGGDLKLGVPLRGCLKIGKNRSIKKT